MAVTIKDVAKKACVSNATVSRVLSNQPNVSEEVRKRVLDAAQELRYQPSGVARSFRNRKSNIIGLIVSDIVNPFYTGLARTVEDIASQKGYALFLCNTDEEIHREEVYIDFMIEERVAGVLMTPVSEEKSFAKKLMQAGIPVVLLDRKIRCMEIDSVLVDNFLGAYDAVTHLIDLGHTRIGTILGQYATTGRERESGYRQALIDNGIPIRAEYMKHDYPREQNGKEMTRQLLFLPNRPSAIFCGNNLLTIGALTEINEQGLNVPGDIAIAGFDDLDWYGLVEPTITAVRQPIHEVGKKAIELLFCRIEGEDCKTKEIVLQTELFARCSSGKKIIQK